MFIHQQHVLIWIPLNNSSKVKIELYRKNILKQIIVMETENDGKHEWLVPPVVQSNMYKIKITDLTNTLNHITSAYFTIRER